MTGFNSDPGISAEDQGVQDMASPPQVIGHDNAVSTLTQATAIEAAETKPAANVGGKSSLEESDAVLIEPIDAKVDHLIVKDQADAEAGKVVPATLNDSDDGQPAAKRVKLSNIETAKETNKVAKSKGPKMVVILVGEDNIPFVMKLKALKSASEFFEKAFDGNFKESIERKLTLPDVKATAFAMFSKWVNDEQIDFEGTLEEQMDRCIELYHLADRLFCPDFKNYVMDTIQNWLLLETENSHIAPTAMPSNNQIERVFEYDITAEGSTLSLFCVAMVAYWLHEGGSVDVIEDVFLIDGFPQQFITFTNSLNTDVFTFAPDGDRSPGIQTTDNPTVRGVINQRLDDDDDDNDAELAYVPVGYPKCYFHVHDFDAWEENCPTVQNHRSNCHCGCSDHIGG